MIYTDCINSPYVKDKDGYGIVAVVLNGKRTTTRAHRVAYVQANNLSLLDIENKLIRHRCNNTFCVNPTHLLLGTHEDNMRDKIEFGNNLLGEKHSLAKLTELAVKEIRSGEQELSYYAAKYNVSVAAVSLAKNRRTWKHLK
jgi:hypothetical protein